METVNLSLDLKAEVVEKARGIFAELGVSLDDAISIFLHSSTIYRGFPFELTVKRPNLGLLIAMEEGEQIIRDIEAGKNVPTYATAAEMHAAMDAEDEAEGLNV